MTVKPTYEELEKRVQELEKIEFELRKKEDVLRESEREHQNLSELLRLMCDNVPDMIWAKDLEKKYIFANRTICKNLLNATDIEETIGKTDIFFAERERKRFPDNPEWHTFGEICRDTDQITMDAGMPRQFDEYGNVQGKFLFLDVHKAPFIDENGKMIGTVGSARDITELKRAEEVLQKERQRLGLVIEGSGLGTWEWNVQTNETIFNETWAKMLGYTLEELAPTRIEIWSTLVHTEDLKKAEALHAACLAGECLDYASELRMKHKDGHWVWILSRGRVMTHDDQGRPLLMFGTHTDITDIKRSEQALRDSEAKFRSYIEHAPLGVFVTDTQGRYVDVNPAAELITGYTAEQLTSMSIPDLLVPESFEDDLKHFLALVDTGQSYGETAFRRANGSVGCWTVSATRIGPDRYLGFVEDITGRKEREERIALLGRMLDEAPTSITIHDTEGHFLFSNRQNMLLHGYESEEEFLAINLHQLDVPESEAILAERMHKISEEGEARFEAVHFHKDGSTLNLEVMVKTIDWHGQTAVLSIATDITERKRAEEALCRSEERFRIAKESGLDSFLTFWAERDSQGQIVDFTFTDMNTNAEKMLQMPKEHLLGKRMCEELPINRTNGFFEKYKKVVETGIPLEEEFYIPDSHIPAAWCYHQVVRLDDGIAIFHRDITERRQAEAENEKLQVQISQLQKAESLGRMAGAIAHHFNNQLSAVMGNLELSLIDLPNDVKIRENLLNSMMAAQKATEVSRQMLTYIGQTPGKHAPMDLSEACRQNLPLLQAAIPKGITVNIDFPDSGPVIRASEGQINQVLANLITNAWESISNNQGTIDLAIRTVDQVPATKRFPIDWQSENLPYACFEVSDTGYGITGMNIERIFDPFYTTKFTGRGMGLPVTIGILKTHGGCITVENEPGCGCIFRVYLPVTTERKPAKNEKVTTPKRNVGNGGTVLLVEDEASVRNMAKKMLNRLGYKVIEAQDGVEAVRLFQEHQNEIDCVLSDLTMPRMNGWDTLTALRKERADVPVILASGYDEATVMAGDHPEQPQAFLNKPYSMGALKDVLMEVIRL